MKLQIPFVVLAVVLLNAPLSVSQTPSVPARKKDVEILVPVGAKDSSASSNVGFPTPRVQRSDSRSRFSSDDAPKGLNSLFPDREIRRITVIRYVVGWDAQTPAVVQRKLLQLTRRELEPPMNQIGWSEETAWTIEAKMEFCDGASVQILTDGSHMCLMDESGKPCFFRISPAEFLCGYEIPGGSVRNNARNPYCQARGLGVYFRDFPRR